MKYDDIMHFTHSSQHYQCHTVSLMKPDGGLLPLSSDGAVVTKTIQLWNISYVTCCLSHVSNDVWRW